MLSTAFALFLGVLVLSGCGVSAWIAVRASENALDARDELARELRKTQALREEIAMLEARVNRLTGRVYSLGSRRQPQLLEEADAAVEEQQHLDSEIAATLALQKAAPVAPGGPR